MSGMSGARLKGYPSSVPVRSRGTAKDYRGSSAPAARRMSSYEARQRTALAPSSARGNSLPLSKPSFGSIRELYAGEFAGNVPAGQTSLLQRAGDIARRGGDVAQFLLRNGIGSPGGLAAWVIHHLDDRYLPETGTYSPGREAGYSWQGIIDGGWTILCGSMGGSPVTGSNLIVPTCSPSNPELNNWTPRSAWSIPRGPVYQGGYWEVASGFIYKEDGSDVKLHVTGKAQKQAPYPRPVGWIEPYEAVAAEPAANAMPEPLPRPIPYKYIGKIELDPMSSVGNDAVAAGAVSNAQNTLTWANGRARETAPRARNRIPPKKKNKEKKIRVSTAGTLIRAVFDGTTEMVDFITALHKAIPDEYRTHKGRKRPWPYKSDKVTPQNMLSDLYNYWDKADNAYFNRAFDNVVENQLEDYFYGKLGKTSGQAGAAIGRPVGLGLGPVL